MQSIEAKATDAKIDVTAAMEKFLDHTLRGKAPVQRDDWKVHKYIICNICIHLITLILLLLHLQADYVELISRYAELSRLQRAGVGLATVDSEMASLLMVKAYSKKEMDRIEAQISRLEVDHNIQPGRRWRVDEPDFKAGFKILRERYVVR